MDTAFILKVTLIGLLAGVAGTGIGGFLASILRKPKSSLLSLVLGFSAGIMLVIVFMELMAESIAIGGYIYGLLGLVLGIAALLMLDILVPHHHHYSGEYHQSRYRRVGVLLGIGIALHNIPEGLAIGAGYVSSDALGWGLAVIIAAHNAPEGMAMATPLRMGGIKNSRIVLYTALAGLPMALGAFTGALLGSISLLFLSVSLSFAAGAMLYIVFDDLLPDAHELSQGHSATLGAVLGVVAGILLLAIS